ncbi:MAG: DNA helicase PcrA [Acidimicrobiales bacterium]|nr:MAG: ATP-dependent DNA helicase PcrA [marine actinobacterium MedAcidi-G1]
MAELFPSTEENAEPNLKLNPAQNEAVTHGNGPLLVVAGAGSGKTRVLTSRIAHLINEKGISPFEILAITFTNKAAEEMRHRVVELVGSVAHKMWVSTFHSACVRILRQSSDEIGFSPNFTIYDQGDAARLMGHVIKDLNFDLKRFPPRALLSKISSLKNEGINPNDYLDSTENPYDQKVSEIFVEYQLRLKRASAMDFDDLLLNTVIIFRKNKLILEQWQNRFKHVLVDEYQDTNLIQNELVSLLAADHRNICVVGDSDQSIYQFRGADVRNILNFEKVFPDATVIVLDQNYRSTQTILDAANEVISRNSGRQPKDLWTEEGNGESIVMYQASNEDDEAKWVAEKIISYKRAGYSELSDVAIFYRTNAQSRAIEEQLNRLGMAYRVVGGTRFYDRREVRDALAYLRLAVNPLDEVALRRVLNVPKRGVGDTSLGKIEDWADKNQVDFFPALSEASKAGVSGKALKGIESFLNLLEESQSRLDLGPADIIEFSLEKSGYISALEEERTIEAEGRLENLSELVGAASEFSDISEFLERVGLVADTDEIPNEGSDFGDGEVLLMTLHAAKGLEFPVVFLLGMEEGIFPHVRALGDPDQMEEERRLAYVGITRARKILHLCNAWSRMLHGQTQYNPPSRFLDDIPEELIQREGSQKSSRNLKNSTNSYSDIDDWGFISTDEFSSEEPSGRIFGKGTNQPENDSNSSEAHLLALEPGDDVKHKAWGMGVVVSVSGVEDRAEAVISFPSVGEKRLLLAWAPLERA